MKGQAGANEHYNPVDLLNIKINPDSKRLTVIDRTVAAFKDVFTVMNFRSKIIEDYYSEISVFHTKRHVRLSIKYILLFSFSLLLNGPVVYPGTETDLYLALLVFLGSILLYFITFKSVSHTTYSFISIAFCLLAFCTVLYRLSGVNDVMETNYTPGVQLIYLMYAILPLKIEIAISIAILFCIAYESNASSRYSFGANNLTDTRANGNKPWKFFQTIQIYEFDRNKFTEMNYIYGQTILWISINLAGLYLHICNQMRRRAAFLRLGENVKAQQLVKDALKNQVKSIEAIMPMEIRDSYWNERKNKTEADMWVFSRTYNNVSILFADIVGFTNMSSNKTAPQVVTLLNDLFNRFDELAMMTNCEKLGTLGDCYYCVAGCPVPRSDHATCCVEMGLGMCRIIKTFNNDYKESVDMRIGVHTGRVNAAIIGNQRFRFDVYSNDVIIANTMESSGLPGRVHISETCYSHVSSMYNFEKGSDLEVKKEEKFGVAGMKLVHTQLKTFFVDAATSHLLKQSRDIEKGKKADFQIITGTELKAAITNDSSSTYEEEQDIGRLDADVIFVESLRRDPENHIKLFGSPPLWPFTLKFIDSEVERKFHQNTHDEIQPMHVDSVKLAPLFDCIACLLFTVLIAIACGVFFPKKMNDMAAAVALILVFGFTITMFAAWCSAQVTPLIVNRRIKALFANLSHVVNAQSFIMCSLPSLIVYLMLDCKELHSENVYTSAFFSVSLFSIMCHALFISSVCWVNIFSGLISTSVSFVIFYGLVCRTEETACKDNCMRTCRDTMNKQFNKLWDRYITPLVMDFLQTIYVIIALNRENEKNLRLCFYVAREERIRCEQANKAMVDSRELLHNIIPEYVLEQILLRGGDMAKGNFSYAVNVQSSAVIFSCISNFFSSYYREDYKGGEGALRLLNKIICMFDGLLSNPKYVDVEKIKTINDCYMVASGLNTVKVEGNKDPKSHLRALLNYSFDMQTTLEEFNTEYIFGSDKFEMKIGYNIGPVTAGVIGTTKPLYDIWGDTVNVSSRMYSTGTPGKIQVPAKVKELLAHYFKFTYKGEVFVKGKGEMKVYIVSKRPKKK